MLTTSDIESCLRGTRYFLGVFPADGLPAAVRRPATMIVNTDPMNAPGEHWVAVHLRDGEKVDYFDSFGLPPVVPEIQRYAIAHGRNGIRYNNRTMQRVESTQCGDFCICFVQCVAKGMQLPEFVSHFENVLFQTKNRQGI